MMFTTRSRVAPVRSAVTLIELLVVISIIAILLALTGAAIQKTAEVQRTSATKKQLSKFQQSLDAEYEQVVRKCADDARHQGVIPSQVVTYCDNDKERALAVWTAMHLRRHFPQTFAEALSSLDLRDTNSGALLYSLKPLATFDEVQGLVPTGNPNEESAALLYIILSKKSVSGGGAMASSADELNLQKKVTFNVVNTSGNVVGTRELPVFADVWENAIGFRRWDQNPEVQAAPYVDSKPNPFNPNNRDPLDPKNLVFGWSDARKQGDMNRVLQFNGMNRLLSVYSPGRDKATGTADDVLGYQLRQYGK